MNELFQSFCHPRASLPTWHSGQSWSENQVYMTKQGKKEKTEQCDARDVNFAPQQTSFYGILIMLCLASLWYYLSYAGMCQLWWLDKAPPYRSHNLAHSARNLSVQVNLRGVGPRCARCCAKDSRNNRKAFPTRSCAATYPSVQVCKFGPKVAREVVK